MLDNTEKKPAFALILTRLFLGMTMLFVVASSFEVFLTLFLRFLTSHHKNID